MVKSGGRGEGYKSRREMDKSKVGSYALAGLRVWLLVLEQESSAEQANRIKASSS